MTHYPTTTPPPISWQVVEEVASLLEKSLTPFAEVRRNVRLPVIGKTRRRQCDVVITYGSPPRQTVTIVEVQKRARKPDINTFHGWCRKMREVGAQHLICVSMRGYPKSIIDEAATRYGPMVRLLTLNELRKPEVPGFAFVSPFLLHEQPQVTLEQVGPGVRLEDAPAEASVEFGKADKVFTVDDSAEFQSILELISLVMRDVHNAFQQQRRQEPNSYRLSLTLGSVDRTLWLHIDGQPYRVLDLPTNVRVEITVLRIPLTVLEYHQESIEGALAWVAVAEGVSENKAISVRFVFKKDSEGLLRDVEVYQEGVESVGLVVSSDRTTVEAYIRERLQNSE